MGDFEKSVESGVEGAAVGGAVAATGAAIGAAAGASLGPFAPVAAPIGAAVGALIGFFAGLFSSSQTPEQLKAAAEAHDKAVKAAYAMSDLLKFNVIQLGHATWGTTTSKVFVGQLQWQAKANPTWAPMINAYIQAAHDTKYNPPDKDPGFQRLRDFIIALASMSPTFTDDPFAYLRPPLSAVFAPALAAAGINISDPSVLQFMRGQYNALSLNLSDPKWAGIGLTTDMNIYGGPTEADRQKAAKVAAIFARGGGSGPGMATPMMGGPAQTSGGLPTWAYVALGVGVLGGGYYLFKG